MSLPIGPTRILILGGGGREHVLAWKLAAEPGINEVLVAPGSAAIGAEARVRCLPAVDPLDPAAVVEAARASAAELVVVGPEAPLAAGVADALSAAGIAVLGPSRAAARIETSKAFCHEVARAAGVRMARAATFGVGESIAARAFARELATGGRGLVVKADGLAAGKGVTVCDDLSSAEAQIEAILGPVSMGPTGSQPDMPGGPELAVRGSPGGPEILEPRIVLEERLFGPEATVIALTDGRQSIGLPAARDHKRLRDGDEGPNTGGMGAYSPLPDLPDEAVAAILATVHRPILAELERRGAPYRGFLYAGLILTVDGPVLLECNARLGDPEAQAILPRLAGALGPALLAAACGDLEPIIRALPRDRTGGAAASDAPVGRIGPGAGRDADAPLFPVLPGATVAVVLVAAGYPGEPDRGAPISGIDEAGRAGGLVFHAGTAGRDAGYVTNGGRVLAVVGHGSDLAAARETAEHAADRIAWLGLQRRHDIAASALTLLAGAVR